MFPAATRRSKGVLEPVPGDDLLRLDLAVRGMECLAVRGMERKETLVRKIKLHTSSNSSNKSFH
jgi:hypothetical protein